MPIQLHQPGSWHRRACGLSLRKTPEPSLEVPKKFVKNRVRSKGRLEVSHAQRAIHHFGRPPSSSGKGATLGQSGGCTSGGSDEASRLERFEHRVQVAGIEADVVWDATHTLLPAAMGQDMDTTQGAAS